MTNILRFKQLLVTAALLLASVPSFAYDFEVDGIYYNKLSNYTVEVTYEKYENERYKTSSYVGDLVIPSSITVKGETYKVTSIGDNSFYFCEGLTSIKIPDGVTSIGDFAFYECYKLTLINIPDGVTSIGNGAFLGCIGLTSIKIPDGVTSIGEKCFQRCGNLTSINLPEGVTSIGENAFKECGLSSINIPDGVNSIGEGAFMGCNLSSVKIPDKVSSIEDKTFSGCRCLETVSIGKGVTSIGNCAFSKCEALTSIDIPDGVTSIGESAFSASGLLSVTLGNGISSIGIEAFAWCTGLTSVHISSLENWMKINMESGAFNSYHEIVVNGVKLTDLVVPESRTTIGKYTFCGCTSLESITLHKDVSTIEQNAFSGCNNIKKIVCKGNTPPVCETYALNEISRTDCTLYVPKSSIDTYKSTATWNEFKNIVALEQSGINNIFMDGEKLSIIYDFNGRELGEPKHGLNIINGKKVAVK